MADLAAAKRPAYLENFIRVSGHRMRFVQAGAGFPVVLVHGFGLGNTGELAWAKVIPGLAERFHVYAPDLLGFGASDKPSIPYSPQLHVNQLLAFMDSLCLERVALMGNSVGAYITTKCALDYPDRVIGVCAIASSTVAKAMGIDGPDTPGLAMMRTFNGTAEAMRDFLREVTHNPHNITDDVVAQRLANARDPQIAAANKVFQEHARSVARSPKEWQRFSLIHRLPGSQIPMAVIWGENDRFAPVQLGHDLERLLPGVEFYYLKDAGHTCQQDQPDRIVEVATDFFERTLRECGESRADTVDGTVRAQRASSR
jgi:2-hydroxy-6-oxonona-2,4-dienedioate hydrolase